MDFVRGNLAGKLMRLSAVVAVVATLGACSVIPDWMGGDSGPSDSASLPPDQTAADTSQTAAPAQTADASNGQFPDLADTPDRPAAPSTSDEQKQVAGSLAADRNRQNYSADQLRAGQETSAAPPGAPSADDDVAEVDTGSKSAPAPASSSDDSSSAASSTAGSTAPAPAPTTAVASAPTPAPSGGPPAVPAVPASTVNGAQSVSMTDSALGFQPSKAPPLDASVAQFVPQPIISRYQQTASLGGAAGVSGGAAVAVAGGPAVPAVPGGMTASNYLPPRLPAMGGPENMTGAVVANFDAIQGGSIAASGVYANAQGLPPTAVVFFNHDTTILNAAAKAQVRSAADAFNARGATGYIRVVGHASSRSTRMSESRRKQLDFEHSQARATAIARELINDGVPASKVLVEAVGDTQPGSYDSAPQGDDSNRRAEIFFQG